MKAITPVIQLDEEGRPLKPSQVRALAQKKKKEKQKKMLMTGGGVFAFLSLVVWYGMQPILAPIEIGICRTYVELNIPYPQTFRLSSYDQHDRMTRMYYTFTGAFGEQRSNLAECKFMTTPNGSLALESLAIRHDTVEDKIEQDKIDAFNKTIPYIIQNKPNLIAPSTGGPHDLIGLRQE